MDRPGRLTKLRQAEDALDHELETVRARLRELVPPAGDESLYRGDGRRAEPWGPEQAADRRTLRLRERALMQARERLRKSLAEEGIARGLPLLADVRVATPCDARWEDMDGDALVRFCAACKKHVYNVSEMTPDQAESFLGDRASKATCIRLYRRDDGTVITAECSPGLARQRRGRLVAATVAGAAFFTSFAATAAVEVLPPIPAPLAASPDPDPAVRRFRSASGLVESTCDAPQPSVRCRVLSGPDTPRGRAIMGKMPMHDPWK